MGIIDRLRRSARFLSSRRDLGRGGVASRTFVCGDVASFALLTKRIGDERALDAIQRILRVVRHEADTEGGRALELRGDGFLLAFRSPRAAIRCSVAIQRALEVDRAVGPDEEMELRMAVHSGEVLRCANRFVGRNLIIVFRLLEQAEAGQILISSPVRPFVPHGWRYCLSVERSFRPRGLHDRVRFAGIDWARTLPPPGGCGGAPAGPRGVGGGGAANRGGGGREAPARKRAFGGPLAADRPQEG
jgi:class 3 adenylate cyclase